MVMWYQGAHLEDVYDPRLAYDLNLLADLAEGDDPNDPGVVSLTVTATPAVSAWRAVQLVPEGYVVVAQPSAGVRVLGITRNAGTSVTLVRTGVYTDPSWTWDLTKTIILGTDGTLVQNVPDGATRLQNLGIPISATSMIVRLDPPTAI